VGAGRYRAGVGVDVRRWRVRDWLVLAGGLLLLAVSLNTWLRLYWVVSPGPLVAFGYRADAWHAAVAYRFAVSVGLLAAAGWLLLRARAAPRAWLRSVAAAGFGLALVLVFVGRATQSVPRQLGQATTYVVLSGPDGYPGPRSFGLTPVTGGAGWWAAVAVLAGLLLLALCGRTAPRAAATEPPAGEPAASEPAVTGPAPASEPARVTGPTGPGVPAPGAGRRGLGWAVAAVGVLMAAVSLTGWYGISWQQGSGPGGPVRTRGASGNAWQSSTYWTVAVCAGVFGTALWLGYRTRAGRPRWLPGLVLTLVGVGVLLVGWQMFRLNHPGPVHSTSLVFLSNTQPLPPPSVGAITRDRLFSLNDSPAYHSGPRWGAYAGLALLAGQAMLVIADARSGTDATTDTMPE